MRFLGPALLSSLLVSATCSLAADTKITAGKAKVSSVKPEEKIIADEKIVSLRLEPPKITFVDLRESRRVLVFGRTADGRERDLSHEAKLVPVDESLKIDADGFVSPTKEGDT